MAEAVVTFALAKVHDLVLEKGGLSCRVADDVKDLEMKLKEIKGLIEDADKRRHKDKTVNCWIAEIIGLADRAEAAIEIYYARVSSKRRGGAKKLLHRYGCILKECQSLYQLDSEIKNIKSSLEGVTNKLIKANINKKSIDGGESSDDMARETYPEFEKGDCFVGMEKEVKQLVSLIEGEEHGVISVWGMGGLGKTTIAREVYNQMMKKKANCFDRFAWVCITRQFKIRKVLEDVLNRLESQKRENTSSLEEISKRGEYISKLRENDLIKQLIDIQRAHRCLIVIDDLWDISHWNEFKHAFVVEGLQNKVLVTTRKQNLAEAIGFPLKLGNLNMDEAWDLLKKKAFPHNNIPVNSLEKLHIIGTEMLRKCGRLPLAISLLGGVLRNKSTDDHWKSVHKSMHEYISKTEGDEDEYRINGVLGLSYEELPYYLKPCFLYLGTLEEDKSIHVLDLYRMWIAQGMISSKRHGGKEGTLMDIAETYLSELASRCIVEVDDIIPTEKYRSCKLHDVVRKQCLLKGEYENFGVKSLNLSGRNHITSLPRYLVIHVEGKVEQGILDKYLVEHVRSLKIAAHTELEYLAESIVDFQRFKMLRDLVIIRFKFPGRKFPRGITNLVHLRRLCLQECEELDVPSSISKLVYLETLDLEHSRKVRIPNVLKKMLQLKHLILPYYFDEDDIGSYRLRLDEGLDELESLMGFDSRVHELKCSSGMKNLRRLSASVHDNKILSVIMSALDTNWNKLQSCEVLIKEGCQLTSEEGSMMLKQLFTSPNLHILRINVELRKLPVESMNNTVSSKLGLLCLTGCKIEDDPMEILGMLPFFSQLEFWGSFVGEEMTCTASSFPCLKNLRLGDLPNLRKWIVEAGAMRFLSELYMVDCPRLEKVPDGLSSISTLKRLVIWKMPELAKRVAPLGEDFPKVCHIPFIIIDDDQFLSKDEV